jgi:protein-S-isoprenylcysteine O-methyltransferase Ste14
VSFREFARARNPVPPNRPVQALMTGGPFRLSRNPLYLTLVCLHGGIALIAGNGWMLATLPMALLVVRFYVIAREEAYLHRRFGNAYLEYQARVRRWI